MLLMYKVYMTLLAFLQICSHSESRSSLSQTPLQKTRMQQLRYRYVLQHAEAACYFYV